MIGGVPSRRTTFSYYDATTNVLIAGATPWFAVKTWTVPVVAGSYGLMVEAYCGVNMFAAGDLACMDIAIDGVRVSGSDNGLASATEVNSGRRTLRMEAVIRGVRPGERRISIMGRSNSAYSSWGITGYGDQSISLNTSNVMVRSAAMGLPASTLPLRGGDLYDACDGSGSEWSLLNIPGVSGDGSKITAAFDAQGDAMLMPYTDGGGQLDVVAHVGGFSSFGGILGVCALDASGTGFVMGTYDNGYNQYWVDGITSYARDGSRVSVVTGPPPPYTDHWQNLRRVGDKWSCRWGTNGTWWPWSPAYTEARVITQVGLIRGFWYGPTQTIWVERFVAGSRANVLDKTQRITVRSGGIA